MDAAAEIAAGGISATWSPQTDAPPDAALERVITSANEIAGHAVVEPAVVEPEPVEADPEPPVPRSPAGSTIIASPLAAPVVLTVPERAPKTPRRKLFSRRDAFTRRFTRRERVLAKTCGWLVVALALSVLALRLPVGPRPELGANTTDNGPSIGTPETPVTSPFADAVRIQTKADLRVVVATAGDLHSFWKSYVPASPLILGHELPQFAFVSGGHASVRVGQLSVESTKAQIVLAEYAGPKGCAYARLIAGHDAQVVIGASAAPCRATTPPATGWSLLGEG